MVISILFDCSFLIMEDVLNYKIMNVKISERPIILKRKRNGIYPQTQKKG